MKVNQAQGVHPRTSGLAVASLVFAFIFPPLGLVLGIVALVQISTSQMLSGRGLAIAGISVSVLWPMLVLPAILYPVFARARFAAQRQSCLNNLKQIGTAINMYEIDWDDRYPLVSGPGREFERVWPDVNKPFPANLRTKSSGGERRWFQNLIAPYARNRKILMCPAVSEDGTWKTPDGTISYYKNRHGGWTTAEGDSHGIDSRQPVDPPVGSARPKYWTLDMDPPTTYFFNAVTAKEGQAKLISGQSQAICERTADAPLVWDTPCGYGKGSGNSSFAHHDSINVAYADGHVRNFAIPSNSMDSWRASQFWLLQGNEGWFPGF